MREYRVTEIILIDLYLEKQIKYKIESIFILINDAFTVY